METAPSQIHKGVPWLMIGLLVVLAIVLAISATPVIMKANKSAPMTDATSNAKQVFYLLVEFDMDYGEFPSDGTAVFHKGYDGAPDIDLRPFKGEYSNDYLGQLIAGGVTKSEEVFVTPTKKDRWRKADNVISPEARILEAGECGFSYVKNQSTSENSGRPILMSIMSGEADKFDPAVYDFKAVALRIDGAVKQFLLNTENHRAKIGQGQTLFDDGPESVWGSEGFDFTLLVHPKPHR